MTNYFANLFWRRAYTLYLPRDGKDQADRYVQKHSSHAPNSDERPFRTQLDFWAVCAAVAAAQKLEPLQGSPSRWGTKFVDTRSVNISEDLSGFLCVLAIERYGVNAPEALDPGRIVELGNRLAGAGCPALLRDLTDASLTLSPLTKVMNLVSSMGAATEQGATEDGLRAESRSATAATDWRREAG